MEQCLACQPRPCSMRDSATSKTERHLLRHRFLFGPGTWWIFVERGFIPVRLRSSREAGGRGVPAEMQLHYLLGPLRRPTGRCRGPINSLTTEVGVASATARKCRGCLPGVGVKQVKTYFRQNQRF
jgi:hypothetical protein